MASEAASALPSAKASSGAVLPLVSKIDGASQAPQAPQDVAGAGLPAVAWPPASEAAPAQQRQGGARASAQKQPPPSWGHPQVQPERCDPFLLLELGVAAGAGGVLAWRGGGDAGAFRCDLAALALAVGSAVALCSVTVTIGLRAPFDWDWWGHAARLLMQMVAVGVAALALLAHAAAVLLQLLCTAAAACGTLSALSLAARAWRRSCAPPEEGERPLVRALLAAPGLALLAAWALLAAAAAGAAIFRPRGAGDLSDEVGVAEHLLLFGLSGTWTSAALVALALWLLPGGRALLAAGGRAPPPELLGALPRAAAAAAGGHLLAALLLTTAPFGAAVAAVLALVRLALRGSPLGCCRARAPAAEAARQPGAPPDKPGPAGAPGRRGAARRRARQWARLWLLPLGCARVGGFVVLFLFDIALIQKYLVDAERPLHSGGPGLRGPSWWGEGWDEDAALEYGPRTPHEIGLALARLCEQVGLGAPAADASKRAADDVMWLLRRLVDLGLEVPEGVALGCSGTRRLFAAGAVAGVAGTLLAVGALDVLGIMSASREAWAARAAAGLGRLGVPGALLLDAWLRALEHAVLVLLQVLLSSAIELRRDIYGIFGSDFGYFVGADLARGAECDSFWHVPVDFMSKLGLLACGAALVLAVAASLGGAPLGRSPARWAVRSLYWREVRLSRWDGATLRRLAPSPGGERLALLLRPLLGAGLSLGVWTTWASRAFHCGVRQDWYHLITDCPDDDADDAELCSVVGVKQVCEATARGVALAWLPVPYVGGALCKLCLYMNEHVLFAIGHDGGGSACPPAPLGRHFHADSPGVLHALRWTLQAWLCFILAAVEFDLLGSTAEQRRDGLAVCLALVACVAVVLVALDLAQQCWALEACEDILTRCALLVESGQLSEMAAAPEAVGTALAPGDAERVRAACQELAVLPWVRARRLPPERRPWLACAKARAGEVYCATVHSLRVARWAGSTSEFSGDVVGQLESASLVLLLREAVDAELEAARAREAAAPLLRKLVQSAAAARGVELQRWAEAAASSAVAAEAAAREREFRRAASCVEGASAPPAPGSARQAARPEAACRWLSLSFAAQTEGVARVHCRWKLGGREFLRVQEGRAQVSVTGTVEMMWTSGKDPDTFGPGDVQAMAARHQVVLQQELQSPSGGGSWGALPDDDQLVKLGAPTPGPSGGRWYLQEGERAWSPGKSSAASPGGAPVAVALPGGYGVCRLLRWLGAPLAEQAAPSADGGVGLHNVDWTQIVSRGAPGDAAATAPDRFSQARAVDQLEAALQDSICRGHSREAIAEAFVKTISSGRLQGTMTSDESERRNRALAVAARLLRKGSRPPAPSGPRVALLSPTSPASRTPLNSPADRLRLKATLDTMMPEDRKMKALEELRAALGAGCLSVDELSNAIEQARMADVEPMVMAKAEDRLRREVGKQRLALALVQAAESRMIQSLKASIHEAKELGLRRGDFPDAGGVGVLDRAQQVLREEEQGARAALSEALKERGMLKLRRALAQARELGLQDDPQARAAEQRLQAAGERKRGLALLKTGMASEQPELLKAAIHECRRLGPEAAVDLSMAQKRLEVLELAAEARQEPSREPPQPMLAWRERSRQMTRHLTRQLQDSGGHAAPAALAQNSPTRAQARALAALRAAVAAEPMEPEMLRLALEQARGAQAEGEEVRRAEELLLRELGREAGLEGVRKAVAERDVRALSEAIRTCHDMGVPRAKLLTALNQLISDHSQIARVAGDHGLGSLVLADMERERRELHEAILVAEGCARVVCRLRPAGAPRRAAPVPQPRSPPAARAGPPAAGELRERRSPAAAAARRQAPSALRLAATDSDPAPLPGAAALQGPREAAPAAAPGAERAGPALKPAGGRKVLFRPSSTTQQERNFLFSRVFGEDGTQADVFDCVRGLVRSAVDGHNALVLALGPVDSGKTHAMLGEGRETRGVIPRAIEELFAIRESESWRVDLDVDVQFVEIRDSRKIVDLLSSGTGEAHAREPMVRIQRHILGAAPLGLSYGGGAGATEEVVIDNVATRQVTEEQELRRIVQDGYARSLRSASARQCHRVLILNLSRLSVATGAITSGKLVLADLAGCGRCAGPEAAASYSALRSVFSALSRGERRVPYEEHALTQVLQDCLGPPAKTTLLLALSPEEAELQDSLEALELASLAKW